jgi:hypothetical protein
MSVPESLVEFETEISRLVQCLTVPATSVQIVDILSALGCRLIYEPQHFWMDDPDQPSEQAEPLVLSTLVHVLHAYLVSHSSEHDELILLEGLLRKDRWKSLLGTPSDTYAFVTLILSVCDGTADAQRLRTELEDDLNAVFSSWLGVEFDSYPTATVLARSIFGDAWTHFVAPLYIINPNFPEYFHVCAAMRATLPDFLPGLVTWQSNEALNLPILEIA